MADIFQHSILCDDCNKKMEDSLASKNGFNLRIKKCGDCGKIIVHPEDRLEYENFIRLKKKEYEVKMRMVGNSYAVSIPREIVDFMKEQERMIDNMVKLSFEDAGRLRLMFNTSGSEDNSESNVSSRFVKSREVKVIKNNKPVLHARQFVDSAHPERNKTEILNNFKKIENIRKEKKKND